MNKVLAISILGMGVTGAVLIISIAQLFNPTIGTVVEMTTAASTLAFVLFAISAFVLRRRLDGKRE
ncbi:hypothetical protein GKZ89_16945 [Bacillus mangrovi]|uniref:Uncharacterized protein n=1 Tax=Metabacillus mangrovi TaxID=1491830 RepID=A0A7X2V6I1_9BACI|nr:hypothetical protein [Metabacillus mangrovi]MTH55093.1 hypothetical protein [Metabacillus mangrovi]